MAADPGWLALGTPRRLIDLALVVLIAVALMRVLKLAGDGQIQPAAVALAIILISIKLVLDAVFPLPAHKPPSPPDPEEKGGSTLPQD